MAPTAPSPTATLADHEKNLVAFGRFMLNPPRPLSDDDWATMGRLAAEVINGIPVVRSAIRHHDALRRLASPDEMGGMGVLEDMTGPAAVELRVRLQYASASLAEPTESELRGMDGDR